MSRAIEELRRAVERDPEDHGAAHALAVQRAHLEGPGVYLEPLRDRERWNSTPGVVQDLAIEEVGRRCGGVVELAEVRAWSCETLCSFGDEGWCMGDGVIPDGEGGESLCAGCGGSGRKAISHRLATFRHRETGMELNLLPGKAGWKKPIGFVELDDGHRDDFYSDGGGGATKDNGAISPFLMGRWPVTSTHWHRGEAGRAGENPDRPITLVSHEDSMAWCGQLGLALPSTEQWEHACRAGTTTRFYWGDEMDDLHCWHEMNSRDVVDERPNNLTAPDGWTVGPTMVYSDPRPHAPKEHDASGAHNAFGLVDMVGNVWEYATRGYERPVVKGGGFDTAASSIPEPSAHILWSAPGEIQVENASAAGFRAALNIPGL